ITAANADGDGKTDIVIANIDGDNVDILRNNSPGIGVLPPPVIESFTPVKATPGTLITISGKNFSTDTAKNAVFFGTVKGKMLTATGTQLQLESPIGIGFKQLSVLNKTTNLSASSQFQFSTNFNGKSSINASDFAPAVRYYSNRELYSFAFGDLDVDGKLDIVSVIRDNIAISKNISSKGKLSTSSFAPSVEFIGPEIYGKPAIADIDGDGKPEILVIKNNNISIFRNIATKGVINASSFATRIDVKGFSGSILVEDMDNDGKPDIISFFNDQIRVFRNSCTLGNITAAGFTQVASLSRYATTNGGYTIVDIDGDGKKDIVVGFSLSIYQNITKPGGAVEFKLVDFPGVPRTNYNAVADLNGDGKMDIVSTNPTQLVILYGEAQKGNILPSAFSIDRSVVYPFTSFYGLYPNIIDINGDGKLDILLGNTIFKNNGTAPPSKATINIPSNSYIREIGDLDGDGAPEIGFEETTSNGIGILKNNLILTPTTLAEQINTIPKTAKVGYELTVYPNPTNTGIGFVLDNYNGKDINVLLTNLNGKTIHTENFKMISTSAYYKLGISKTLGAGIYILKLTGSGLTESRKVVVQ
ncbi:MAG: T9SS type A sorting domain-containing protein, partial [Sphingobacteriaceae bacterium]